jgi:glycosyltransferase involved in cell wall biosynthesis
LKYPQNSVGKKPRKLPMKVLVFEPNHNGHRFEFAGHLIRELSAMHVEIVLSTSHVALRSEEFATFLLPLQSQFEVDVVCESTEQHGCLKAAMIAFDWFSKSLSRVNPDHAFVLDASGLTQVATIKSRLLSSRFLVEKFRNTEALLMSGRFGYSPETVGLGSRVSELAVQFHPWLTAFHLDPYQVQYLSRNSSAAVELLPDPVASVTYCSKTEARSSLGLPLNGRYIGCSGWIQRAKGCDLLVQAFANAVPRLEADCRLLLAGVFRDGIDEWINTTYRDLVLSKRIIALNKFLSPNEIDWAIQAMDTVCLPYHRVYQSSGVFLRAISQSKPVLANDCGWMSRTLSDLQMGSACDVNDLSAFSNAIVQTMGNEGLEQSDRLRRFLQFHSVENFVATWTKKLRAKMGLEPSGNLLSWNWVFDKCCDRSGEISCGNP